MLTQTSHQLTQPRNDQPLPIEATSFLELEITGLCQLKCSHCYADSGPEGDHGTMTTDDWERVLDHAHALSVDTVQSSVESQPFIVNYPGSFATHSTKGSRSTFTPTSSTLLRSYGNCSPCRECR